ncbi:MAG: hypothetical protein WCP35_19395, partial [Verrucomicrobiota bacterium]
AQIKGFKGQASATDWVRGVLDLGGWDALDVVAYHDAPMVESGTIEAAVQADSNNILRPIQQKFPNSTKPIWITDAAPTRINSSLGFYNVTVPFQNQEESLKIADETCRYMIAALETGAQKIFINESKPSAAPFLPGHKPTLRTLTTDDGYLNPSAAAFSNLAWQLDSLHFEKKINPTQGINASIFNNQIKATAVLLTQTGSEARYRLPVRWGVTCVDMLGNPVARDAELRNQLVYVTVPAWLINIDAVLQGRGWIINNWLAVALAGVVGIIAAAVFLTKRKTATPNGGRK